MSKPRQLNFLDELIAPLYCTDEVGPDATRMTGVAAPVLLNRIDDGCNMHRFYSLELATSLFSECGVVRHWGRIGTWGRGRTDWYENPCDAESSLEGLLSAKRSRGYAP